MIYKDIENKIKELEEEIESHKACIESAGKQISELYRSDYSDSAHIDHIEGNVKGFKQHMRIAEAELERLKRIKKEGWLEKMKPEKFLL